MPAYRVPPVRKLRFHHVDRLEERLFVENGVAIYKADAINLDGTGYGVEWPLDELVEYPEVLDGLIHRARQMVLDRAEDAANLWGEFYHGLRTRVGPARPQEGVTGGGKT